MESKKSAEPSDSFDSGTQDIIGKLCHRLAVEASNDGKRTLRSILARLIDMDTGELKKLVDLYDRGGQLAQADDTAESVDPMVKKEDPLWEVEDDEWDPWYQDTTVEATDAARKHEQTESDAWDESAVEWLAGNRYGYATWSHRTDYGASSSYNTHRSTWMERTGWSAGAAGKKGKSTGKFKGKGKSDDNQEAESRTLYIDNLPEGSSADEIWEACGAYGDILDVRFLRERFKNGRSVAFVVFDDKKRAFECLDASRKGYKVFEHPGVTIDYARTARGRDPHQRAAY